jgi:hypothetical protein
VLWARRGQFERAGQDINWCLEREPAAGITLYAAACVSARVAEKTRTPLAKVQALTFLQQALEHGYGRDRAANDPDLAVLRGHSLFREMLARPPSDRAVGANVN